MPGKPREKGGKAGNKVGESALLLLLLLRGAGIPDVDFRLRLPPSPSPLFFWGKLAPENAGTSKCLGISGHPEVTCHSEGPSHPQRDQSIIQMHLMLAYSCIGVDLEA